MFRATLFIVVLPTLLCCSSYAQPRPTVNCQKLIKKALANIHNPKGDLINITEYDLPLGATTIRNTVYTSQDCHHYHKKFSNVDPDFLHCANGHLLSVLPASEIAPHLSCIKSTICYKNNCKDNIIKLQYDPSTKTYTKAFPEYAVVRFQPVHKREGSSS